ncbi:MULTISPECIES: DedA family protein [Arthrobacter]|uniref:Alkaline phosphatase n=1 Tax=Arthrobacter terricola TaxID=2547396 RepID=A0A4R5KVQ3_9MICC|nr:MULTISPECIES: VTT domain-containing protein [Arthrobacter]MBT8159845.1 VTT domain-containing protein [Arthrobacter sp. GN70]TDF99067.1 alkaline phosphatase [Arthrobacter terricola]
MFDPTTLLQGLGPAALGIVALIVFIESGLLFPFLPGDSLLFTAGLLHQQLQVGLPVLIAIVSVAAVAGDQVGYLLGRRFGRRWFKDDAKVMKTAHLQAAEDFFARRGGPAIVLARFVPVVRTFAPLAAGAARYGYKSFTLWNIAGAVIWGTSVTLLGAWLGHFEFVAKNIDVIAVIMVLVSVLPWGVEFLKRRKAAAAAAADTEDNTVGAVDGRAGE